MTPELEEAGYYLHICRAFDWRYTIEEMYEIHQRGGEPLRRIFFVLGYMMAEARIRDAKEHEL